MNVDAVALDQLIESIVSGEQIAPQRFGALASGEHARHLARDLEVIATIAEMARNAVFPDNAGCTSRIGRFELGSPLGAGGMGTVWEARDTTLERTVAIKFLHPHLSGDAKYRERFLREGRAVARLRHRGICAIYEVGETIEALSLIRHGHVLDIAPGTPFAAIELVRGETLQSRLRRTGRMQHRDVLRVAIEAADALAAAHEIGIVHRDIKPANIMLGSDGRVVILDFGLAGIDSSIESMLPDTDDRPQIESDLTMDGDIIGTLAYMSPEQAGGRKVDTRTDVFSFGLALWEMLTGTSIDADRSVGRKTAIAQRAKQTDFFPDQPPVPKAWRALLQRCLAANPRDRHSSAKDLLSDLRARAQSPRRGRIWPLAGGVAALAGMTAGGWFFATRDHPIPRSEPIQRQLTSNPPETAVHTAAISPDGTTLAFADPTGTYLRVIQTGATRKLIAPETLNVTSISWIPDGTRLVMTAISPSQPAVSAWTLSVRDSVPHKLRDLAIAGPVSPDGSKVLLINLELHSHNWVQHGVWVTGTSGEDAHEVLPWMESLDYQSVSWSPDGTRLLFVRGGGPGGGVKAILGISDLTGGPTSTILSDPALLHTACSSNAAWLPNGRILFSLAEAPPNETSGNFWELRIDPKQHTPSGKPTRLTYWADSCIANLDAPPDGSHLTFLKQHRQSDVYLGELRENGDRIANVRRLTLDDRNDFASAWTRDSRSVYLTSNRHGTFDIFKQGVEDLAAEAVIEGPGRERRAQLSPDGLLLVYQVDTPGQKTAPARLMRLPIAGGAPELVLQHNDIAMFLCPTMASASCVAQKAYNRELSFYHLDPRTGLGREIGRIDTGFANWNLSPDGSRIAVIGDGLGGGTPHKGILAMNVSDGAIEDLHVEGVDFPEDLSWSADGKSLFITDLVTDARSPGRRVVHADVAGHLHVLWQSRIVWGHFFNPLPSPDGKYLAFGQEIFESNAWMLENF